MLRHACGYALADQGGDTRLIQDYLGHRNIHTPPAIRRDSSGSGSELMLIIYPRTPGELLKHRLYSEAS